MRPLDIHEYIFGSQSCSTRLKGLRSARLRRRNKPRWQLWSYSGRSRGIPRETGLPRRRSRSSPSCSRGIHRRYASRYRVVGIPTSLSRLRLAAFAANRSPPSRSAPPRQPSRPSRAVGYSYDYSVAYPCRPIPAILSRLPLAISRNSSAKYLRVARILFRTLVPTGVSEVARHLQYLVQCGTCLFGNHSIRLCDN